MSNPAIIPQSTNKMTNPPPRTLSTIEVLQTSSQDNHINTLSSRQRDEILLINPDLGAFTADIPIFIVLVKDGEPIACGGLRLIDEEESKSVAEIKRVYVVPEARGQAKGISDFLLKQLELHAAERAWKTLRLQTSKNMVAANRFYERHGYGLIPNYGEYVDSSSAVSYEKAVA
jgi:GNAT superfamily N-acetyltransferase